MTEDRYTIESFAASDGYRWQFRNYPAKPPRRGRLICLHGIQSHAGWYEHSSSTIAAAGWEVSFLERRGSGGNDRERGDMPSFRRALDDVAEFLEQFRDEPAPKFLSAISWGGKLATALPRRRAGLIDGLILLCPGLFPKVGFSFAQRVAIVKARLFSPAKTFPIPLNDPELFTQTPQWLEFLRSDPLTLRHATARFFVESVRLDRYLRSCPKHITVPVLLMLAGRDRVIDNEATRRFINRCATNDKTIVEYAEAHHTLEFEPDRNRHVNDLIKWLAERSGQ